MKKVQILTICAHKEILKTLLRLINTNEEWNALGAKSDTEAIELFKQHDFDLVLIGAGIQQEVALKRKLKSLQPEVVCIDHYGGGSGLLRTEIVHGIEKRKNINN